ncbi:hypothetical protein H4S02_000697 [Coemansia sp. RSA 2611]|nr:hypothetical protein H4S02_000697 [Coemansia sp. RSA 2611]
MLESSHVHEFENKKITYVNNAVACGYQHCVKRVTLVVSMGNFNAEWDSHSPNLASIISNCGILRSVKTVTYYFVFGYPLANGDYVVPESAQRFNAKSRVCIACKVLSSRGKFFKGIGMARKRSAYNEHTWLDDAQISFDDFC